jgi:hypothetical protein
MRSFAEDSEAKRTKKVFGVGERGLYYPSSLVSSRLWGGKSEGISTL